jgi:hypothetical protein
MKPFRNAYEAIKRLLASIFKKGGEDEKFQESEAEIKTREEAEKKAAEEKAKEEAAAKEREKAERDKVVQQVKNAANKSKGTGAGAKTGTKTETKTEAKAETKTEAKAENKQTQQKAAQQKSAQQKQKNKVKAPDADYVSKSDQEAYDEEVKRRLERAAKREREEKKAEQRAARREMEAQNSVGGKKVIDPVTGDEVPLGTIPAEAVYLKKYSRIPTTSDAVITAINSIVRHPDMSKNIVILGRNGFGTVKVGEDFARSFFAMGLVTSDKIAKIRAKQLNKMPNLEKLNGLKGGCLIIENSGLVQPEKLVEVIKNSDPAVNDYVVILTGEIDSLAAFFEDNPEIVDQFIYLVDIHRINERGMIALARGYVKEKGFTADKAVYEKLKGTLASMEEGNIDRFVEFLDGAMKKCEDREKSDGITGKKELLPQDI